MIMNDRAKRILAITLKSTEWALRSGGELLTKFADVLQRYARA